MRNSRTKSSSGTPSASQSNSCLTGSRLPRKQGAPLIRRIPRPSRRGGSTSPWWMAPQRRKRLTAAGGRRRGHAVRSIRPEVPRHFLRGVPPSIPETRLGLRIFVMCPGHGQVQFERPPGAFRQVAADAGPSVESVPRASEFRPPRLHPGFGVRSPVDGCLKARPPWSPHRTPVAPPLYLLLGPGRPRSPVCNPGIHRGLRHPTHASSL